MKFMMMISIVAIGAFTAHAQYFKSHGRVYARQDILHDYLISKYIETKWLYAAPMTTTVIIESPIVTKKLKGYAYSSQRRSGSIQTSSIDKANRHHRERPWQKMYLRPLLDLAYSLYEPRYIPNGN